MGLVSGPAVAWFPASCDAVMLSYSFLVWQLKSSSGQTGLKRIGRFGTEHVVPAGVDGNRIENNVIPRAE